MAKYKVEISGINTGELTCLTQTEMVELFKEKDKNEKEK